MHKVVVGSDHGGLDLKRELVKHLESQGVEVEDVGCHRSSLDVDRVNLAPLVPNFSVDAD